MLNCWILGVFSPVVTETSHIVNEDTDFVKSMTVGTDRYEFVNYWSVSWAFECDTEREVPIQPEIYITAYLLENLGKEIFAESVERSNFWVAREFLLSPRKQLRFWFNCNNFEAVAC